MGFNFSEIGANSMTPQQMAAIQAFQQGPGFQTQQQQIPEVIPPGMAARIDEFQRQNAMTGGGMNTQPFNPGAAAQSGMQTGDGFQNRAPSMDQFTAAGLNPNAQGHNTGGGLPLAAQGLQQANTGGVAIRQGQQATPQQVPATGLIGAEQALTGGALGATQALLEAGGIASGNITQGGQNALQAIQGGQQLIQQGFNQAGQTIGNAAGQAQGLVQGGVTQGLNQLQVGGGQAQNLLRRAGTQAQGLLNQGVGAIQTGAQQGLGQINQGVGAIREGSQAGMQVLNDLFQQAVDPLTGFVDPGQQAQLLEAAMTGAAGPEAQRAAIANFSNDPAAAFALEEAERATTRNAAAIGGLGGGRVRQELQRQAQGIQNQQFNTRINQLGSQAALGLSAASNIGQLRGTQGQVGAGILSQQGRDIGNLRQAGAGILAQQGRDIGSLRQSGAGIAAQIGGQQANVALGTSQDMAQLLQTGAITQAQIETNAGQQIADLESRGSLAGADLATIQAQVEQSTGINLAQIAQSTGANISQIVENLGAASAQVRTTAGRDLAAAIAQSSAQLANLQSQQGSGISDIVGGAVSNIGNLLLNEGLTDAASQQQQATILANIAVGSGSQASNIAQNVGNINASGILGQNSAIQTALGSLAEQAGDSNFMANIFGGNSPQQVALAQGAAGAFGTASSN